jgi:hypothetical protein
MTLPQTDAIRRRQWPADYYSSATPPPVLPSWATFGCGAASIAILLLVFAGGAWLSRGGFTDFMDMALGMSVAEMRGMYAEDVAPEQRKSLDEAVESMREALRDGKVTVAALQPFMQEMQKSVGDRKVTPAEAKALEDTARRINSLRRR